MNAQTGHASILAEQFRLQITENPANVAVVSQSGTLTYRDLGRATAAIQTELIDRRPRTVGLYATPCPDLVAAAWAALCSGIPYVPLSPTYPDERIRFMVTDGDVDLILVPPGLRAEIRAIVADLDVAVLEIPATGPREVPDNLADTESPAYVLYTSGSTGVPNGVEISHTALGYQLDWVSTELGLWSGRRIVHKTPISFDAAQWELLGNATGATVVAAGAEDYRDPESLIDTIIEYGVTHLQVVPTLLQALCEEPRFGACRSLRLLASGGEALPGRLAALAAKILPDAEIVNLYGPTETTINAASHRISAETGSGTVPIGLPVKGLDFHLLDEDGHVTTVGSGELAIAGPQLAIGYRNRPEVTARRFVTRTVGGVRIRLYRTGDRVEFLDGVYHFRGRTDSQVKIRGHRIELDEVRSILENHDWVRHAGVFTVDQPNGRGARLTAYVELNPHEAALMDQGVHGAHHQSKASRVQVRAQIAGLGVREDHSQPGIPLTPGDREQRLLEAIAFGRKTYRNFRAAPTDLALLGGLGNLITRPHELPVRYRPEWTAESAAFVLSSLVQYRSDARLLPKYAYASPGALYGVQVYARITGVPGLSDAVYYLNPRTATLHPVHAAAGGRPGIALTLIGQRSVISSVYRTNIDEVLRFEAGHLLGLLDTVAPAVAHVVGAAVDEPVDPLLLGGESGDRFVLGTWPLVPRPAHADPLDDVRYRVEVFAAGGDAQGLYEPDPADQRLVRISDAPLVRRKDVIAINQRVHDQASFGLVLTSTGTPESYIGLGRALQRAQHNQLGLGLMSSGYSSYTGRPLATARRIQALAGEPSRSSYFALGGPVTADQIAHTGMDEDALHTQGPAEIITTDVAAILPHYMLPDVIRIVDELPRTPNGKIHLAALRELEAGHADPLRSDEPVTAPESLLEHQLVRIWSDILEATGPVSTTASFFALGGNSIAAARLTRALRTGLGVSLPVQAIFEYDTIVKQAKAIGLDRAVEVSRAVPLAGAGTNPVFLWPGLGGYPMNLRPLAEAVVGPQCRCYGFQAHGLNPGEEIDHDIVSMARRDIEQLRRVQPHGPYNLIGYSFGARVAFEVAHQLEGAGETVARVILLAPGSPVLQQLPLTPGASGQYADSRFTRVLYSVFFARTDGADADRVVAAGIDRDTFLDAIAPELELDRGLAERITRLVEMTYSFEYTFDELVDRQLDARVTVIRATGDDYSFLDAHADHIPYAATTLDADHYQILRPEHLGPTATAVIDALTRPTITELPKERILMPHVAIKHFPATFTEAELATFIEHLSILVRKTFKVDDSAVSVALESVQQENWDAEVYQPEIVHRKQFLVKAPQY